MYAMNALASSSSAMHAYAHVPASHVPRAVKWAQEHGLLISRAAHARHHRPPHDTEFGIVTGWCNPLVSRLLARRRPGVERVERVAPASLASGEGPDAERGPKGRF